MVLMSSLPFLAAREDSQAISCPMVLIVQLSCTALFRLFSFQIMELTPHFFRSYAYAFSGATSVF